MNSEKRQANNATSCVVVLGGSGAIGTALVQSSIGREKAVIATYCDQSPPKSSQATWVRYDGQDASALATEVNRHIDNSMCLKSVIFCIGRPSSKVGVVSTPPNEFSDLFRSNVLSFVAAYRELVDAIRVSKARVVVLSSEATATVSAGNGAYTAAKAALEAIAVTLAKEEAKHGVRVNVLAPSLVDSPMGRHVIQKKGASNEEEFMDGLPWGRALTITEVANAALDLVTSEHWKYASGQIFRLAVARQ